MAELLTAAATGLLAGAWLVGGRVAFGIAVMTISAALAALALLYDVPDQADRRDDVRRRAG
jgi:hypothetical protein